METNFEFKYLKNLGYIILGLIVIFFIIYRRVLVNRLPRSLELFVPELNYNLLIVITFWFGLCIYIIIKSIQIVKHKAIRESIINRVGIQISAILDQAYLQVYNLVANKIPDNYDKVSSFAKLYYKFWSKRPDEQIHMVVIICRFIILGAFLFDVFYLFELKWFYKSLILVCIPLIINIIVFILRDFSSNLEDISKTLVITLIGIDPVTKEPIHSFQLAEGYESLNLDYHMKEYFICSKITGYLKWYDILKAYFTPRVNIIIYSLYLIGWLYVIYMNLALLLSF